MRIWTLHRLRCDRGTTSAIFHVDSVGNEHPCTKNGHSWRCDWCQDELLLSTSLDELPDLMTAISQEQTICDAIVDGSLPADDLVKLAGLTPLGAAMEAGFMGDAAHLDHHLLLAAA